MDGISGNGGDEFGALVWDVGDEFHKKTRSLLRVVRVAELRRRGRRVWREFTCDASLGWVSLSEFL